MLFYATYGQDEEVCLVKARDAEHALKRFIDYRSQQGLPGNKDMIFIEPLTFPQNGVRRLK